jgi:hypothetical protein
VAITCNSGLLPERTTEKLAGTVATEGGQLNPKSDTLTVYVQALSYLYAMSPLSCVVDCLGYNWFQQNKNMFVLYNPDNTTMVS